MALLFCLTVCGSNSPSDSSSAEAMEPDVSESDSSADLATEAENGKILVVYYSATGSTERVANVIATAADGKETMERTMDGLYGFIDCLPGAKVKGKIYGAGVYQKGEVTATKAMEQAYQYGKQC